MVPIWYWFIAAVLLIWNLIGCGACYSQMTANADKIAKWPEAQRAAWLVMPMAPRLGYVVAVGGGLLATIALLLRSIAAGPLFIVSLIGVIIQFGWFFFIYKGLPKASPSSAAFPLFITLVTLGEIAFACAAKSHGWLG